MGLDIWAVKLKNEKDYCGEDCWSLIDNKSDKKEELGKYLTEEYEFNSREVCSFMNEVVIREMEYEKGRFMGDPILNPVVFKEIVEVFEKWIETKFNNRYKFRVDENFEIDFEAEDEAKEFILKLFEYLKAMTSKNYTMWFSI